MLGLPVSFLILRALCLRSVGAYVSGRKIRNNSETPATIKATQ